MDFAEEIRQRFIDKDSLATCRNVTFQVTDDCCLNCSYCYQIHKGHAKMTNEVAKQIIDLLFTLYDKNEEDAFINHHTYGIILDFIGGEPLMNIEVMQYTIDYFIEQCYIKDHIWLTNFRASICSNGVLYFEPKVQEFLNKYNNFISFDITIDGPKEVHDLCRKDYNNKGSFDRAIAAWDDIAKHIGSNNMNTKITIAPENLSYLVEIFNFFLARGCKHIHANPIYEHEWTIEEASRYYRYLIEIANRLLEEDATSTLFGNFIGKPLLYIDNMNYCGGTSLMIAFDPQGNAYPCLRYMKSSLGDSQPPIIVGNCQGIYNTPETQAIYNDMKKVTRLSQSSDECINCPVAGGCSWCSAANYQLLGSYNKRSTNICWMQRARSLANVHYQNLKYKFEDSEKRHPLYLPRDIATKLITQGEYDRLLRLASN